MSVPLNPETSLKGKQLTADELKKDLPVNMKFSQWRKVEVEEKGRKKQVMRIVETEFDQDSFIGLFSKQAEEFRAHVYRVGRQYQEIKRLTENLPENQFILQMDFAENYCCKSNEEIQSAYWNQAGVTLHPIIAYYMSEGDEKKLEHKFRGDIG